MIRSLYLKIFLWFWLAMIVVSGTLVFSVMATQRRLAEAREERMDSTMTPLIAAEAARIFEQEGKSGLHEYFRKFGNDRHFHPLFYDSDGREILGQSTFADADAVAQLAEQNDVTHVKHEGKGRLVGQRTSGPSGARVRPSRCCDLRWCCSLADWCASGLRGTSPRRFEPFGQRRGSWRMGSSKRA